MDDLILVDGQEVNDWQRVRKRPSSVPITPQRQKFKEYGRRVREECAVFKGDPTAVKACQKRVRDEIFKKD